MKTLSTLLLFIACCVSAVGATIVYPASTNGNNVFTGNNTFTKPMNGSGINLTNLGSTNVAATFSVTLFDTVIMTGSPTNSMNGVWKIDTTRTSGSGLPVWTNSVGWTAGAAIALDTQGYEDITNGAGNMALQSQFTINNLPVFAPGHPSDGAWQDVNNDLTATANMNTDYATSARTNGIFNQFGWQTNMPSNMVYSNYDDETPPALLVHGVLEINSHTNYTARGNKAETWGAAFGQYAPEATGQNMSLYMGPMNQFYNSSQASGTRHSDYLIAAGGSAITPGNFNHNFNVGYGGWSEWDLGDNAQMILHANGGVSIDGTINSANGTYGGSADHPNWALVWSSRGPGTNSFSVRSNIYSRYGSLVFTNGGVWMAPLTKANGHALTNAFGVFGSTATGWMYYQTDATAGIHYFDGANWKVINGTATDN